MITNLTGTKWVINAEADLSSLASTVAVTDFGLNFTAVIYDQVASYNTLRFSAEEHDEFSIQQIIYYDSVNDLSQTAYEVSEYTDPNTGTTETHHNWMYKSAREITITDGTDVQTQSIVSWFNENAVCIEAPITDLAGTSWRWGTGDGDNNYIDWTEAFGLQTELVLPFVVKGKAYTSMIFDNNVQDAEYIVYFSDGTDNDAAYYMYSEYGYWDDDMYSGGSDSGGIVDIQFADEYNYLFQDSNFITFIKTYFAIFVEYKVTNFELQDIANVLRSVSDTSLPINFPDGFKGTISSLTKYPEGTLTISQNGWYGVTEYASVNVNIEKIPLLVTQSLGTINVTSTQAIDSGIAISVPYATAYAYDVLLVDIIRSAKNSGYHRRTLGMVFLTGTTNITIKDTAAVGSNKWNSKMISGTVESSRQSTTAYGIYPYSATISDTTVKIRLYERYHSTYTGTINGSYTCKVYGLAFNELV